jgi:ABC-type transport system substrate-binding protein
LTRTGPDNLTRPWLLEKWEASEDLKTWTLLLKKGIKWSNAEDLVADHVIWNMKRWIDEKVGSSILGLMSSYMTVEVEAGEKDVKGNPKKSKKIWADNAIEKVDDHTIRLICRTPQLAVPEHLFHYPALILHPSSKGKFGVGAVGTGAYNMVEYEVNKKVVLKRRDRYWGKPAAIKTVGPRHGETAETSVCGFGVAGGAPPCCASATGLLQGAISQTGCCRGQEIALERWLSERLQDGDLLQAVSRLGVDLRPSDG